jgi:predicted DsbA family dithiol-disulfide isomerase
MKENGKRDVCRFLYRDWRCILLAVLEVFFDYACPYCLQGHHNLSALIGDYPEIEILWRPCEAHPRPETYGRHSDLCARGYYFARDQGADLVEYHRRMYRAALTDRAAIEELPVLAQAAEGLFDADAFIAALSGGAYLAELAENNRLAWAEYRFPAVPSYRMNGTLLKAAENVGVTKERLKALLDTAQ